MKSRISGLMFKGGSATATILACMLMLVACSGPTPSNPPVYGMSVPYYCCPPPNFPPIKPTPPPGTLVRPITVNGYKFTPGGAVTIAFQGIPNTNGPQISQTTADNTGNFWNFQIPVHCLVQDPNDSNKLVTVVVTDVATGVQAIPQAQTFAGVWACPFK